MRQHILACIEPYLPLIGVGLANVGDPVTLVGDPITLVGDPVTLVGDPITLVGVPGALSRSGKRCGCRFAIPAGMLAPWPAHGVTISLAVDGVTRWMAEVVR